ncbi:MAG: HEAT repeat domain-containing protein [Gemmatimonadetes bacterium]|nr:HEAT repeat domain-containing protein [Gemmatimonadota bacterium]
MDHSAVFARHFARLVGLLVTEGSSVDEQKVSLRAALQFAKEGSVIVAREGRNILSDGVLMSEVFPGVKELGARMQQHGVREFLFAKDAAAVEVLGTARILAGPFVENDGGRNFHHAWSALGCNTIHVTTDVRIGEVAEEDDEDEDDPADDPAALFGFRSVLSDAQRPTSSPQYLVERLGKKKTTRGVAKSLDRLATLAEAFVREGRHEDVIDIADGIISNEANAPTADAKRAYIQTVRRLAKSPLLNGMARLVRRNPDQRDRYVRVLSRVGEDGANAVFRQVMAAHTLHDRAVYFGVLRELSAAVPALIHTLVDERWYVVRAAADLLGEMAPEEAEAGLIALLLHADDRVRRTALRSLGRLGTFRAGEAIKRGLKDASGMVRAAAALALASHPEGRFTGTLAAALDEEADEEVQFTIVRALGMIGGPDAVQRLARAASAEVSRTSRMKRSALLRIVAIQALGEARSPAAIIALKELAADRDKEVREAAQRALAGARNTPSGSHRALTPSGSHRPVTPSGSHRALTPSGSHRPVTPSGSFPAVTPGSATPVAPTPAAPPGAPAPVNPSSPTPPGNSSSGR